MLETSRIYVAVFVALRAGLGGAALLLAACAGIEPEPATQPPVAARGTPPAAAAPAMDPRAAAEEARALLAQAETDIQRARARKAMDYWFTLTRQVVSRGIERGELRPDADPDAVATLVIATLEGATMLGKLYDQPVHVRRAIKHLAWYIDGTLRI